MLTKFAIDYQLGTRVRDRSFTHLTDDPIEAEDFLMHLLIARARVTEIRHAGVLLERNAFDQMLKVAAERVASDFLRTSLALDGAEVKDRFGFAA